LIIRCDSAAIVPNIRELLPEPETPVNTVSRRFGISTLTSLRLFTRAPCTRIRPWLSATCSAGDCVSVVVAMLIVSPSLGGAAFAVSVGVAWLDLAGFEQYVWFSFASTHGASGPRPRDVPAEASDQPAAVAHQLAAGQLVHLAPGLDATRGDRCRG
jgi:hypothetical protein